MKRARVAAAAGAVLVLWAVAAAVLPRGVPLGIVLLGAVYGSLTALLAIGVLLVYRANRVVNFAQAELGSIAGVVVVWLAAQRGWPYVPSVAIGLVLAVAVGVLVDVTVIRRLRHAPRLIVAVATIAAAQVLFGASVLVSVRLSRGLAAGQFTTPFDVHFTISPVRFSGDHLMAVVVPLLLLGGLATFLRTSAYGVAVRAAADNDDRARLIGIPVERLSTLVWAMAALFSAVAVILRVPISGFSTFTEVSGGGTALLLRTLAAAVIARMERPAVAVGAAIGLGIFESTAAWSTGNSTLVDALLVGVILVALLVQRGAISRLAGTALATARFSAIREVRPVPHEVRDVPEVRIGLPALRLVVLAFAVGLPLVASPSRQQLATLILVYAIVAVSLVVLTGWAGQISLGQWALVGVGGTTMATLYERHGWDFFAAAPADVAAAALVALVIGLPALRVRGPFLAVTTLAFALTASTYFLQPKYFPWLVTDRLVRPALWDRLPLGREWQLYYACLIVLVLVAAAAGALRHSRTGRAMVAMRDNESAAAAVGVSATRVRLTAFVVSGAIAGLAGVLYVINLNGLRSDAFGPEVSLTVFSTAVIGGLGSVTGAVLGAVYIGATTYYLSGGWTLVASGLGILVLLLVAPGGLGGLLYAARDRVLRMIADRRGIVVPSLVADTATDERPAGDAVTTVSDPDRKALLRVRDLDASYDRVQVLFGVDLDVYEGEILALLGTNGAGKSTLLRAVSGLLPPSRGTVELDGAAIAGEDAMAIAARGVATVPGGRGVFPTLTVADNLRVAAWPRRDDPAGVAEATERVLEWFPILRQRWTTAAGDLSGGEQQMLSLAQAFLGRPRLLLIDELSLGLAPVIVEELLEVVRTMHAQGTTVVIVEQSVNTALRLAERAVFMEKGEVRFTGPTAELLERDDVLHAVFLGRGDDISVSATRSREPNSSATALEVEKLTKRYGGLMAIDGVDLRVAPGEVLGIIGPNGAGKTTLFDLVTGLLEPDEGVVRLDGVDVSDWPAHRRARAGLGRSFQDARLWPALTVRETIAVAYERHVTEPAVLPAILGLPTARDSEVAVARRVDELVEVFGLGAFRDKFLSELSTGSRRIVELATLLAHEPSVVLLDEPSSGIAQRETEALAPMLRDVVDQLGCSMIVIEHDMRVITSLADRMVALDQGAVIAEGTPATVVEHPRVLASYLGVPVGAE